jgi:hypothetical protein
VVSSGSYVLSAALLAVVASSVGFAAFRLRRRLLPAWEGAPARLVEAVLAVALLVWLCELLGLLGILYTSTLVLESLLLAAGVAAWTATASAAGGGRGNAPGGAGEGEETRDGETSSIAGASGQTAMTAVALAAVFLVFAHWGIYAKQALDHGISNFDSLSSYMPFAASMAQTHSVVGIHYTETASTSWLLSQNAELLHAAGILLTHRDTLSLFVNFGWLALAFLAAWCVGRPYGRGPLAVVGAAIVLESSTLIVRDPGTAKDDVMAAALLLAAIAILANAWAARRGRDRPGLAGGAAGHGEAGRSLEPGWPLAAAGLAAGLGAGTKATVLAMVALLSLAAIALAPPGRRRAAAGWWFVPVLAGGGLWYLRNLVVAGNPIPQVTSLGPIALPHPHQVQGELPALSILHYATDTAVWRDYFGPGLERGLGSLWPLLVGAALLGGLLAVRQDRDRALRWIGGSVLLGALAYLATPLSAAGPQGAPSQFWINVRYAAPPLLVGLVVLPLARGLGGERRQWALLAALLALLVVNDGSEAVLHDPGRGFGLLLAVVVVAIPALILAGPRWGASRREVAAGFALLALLLVVVGYPLQRGYLRDRFGPSSGLPGQQMSSAYVWARDVRDARIGLAGTTAGFYQYGFYGTDLSNRVLYLGERGPNGAFNPIPDCADFRAAADEAGLDYLVTSPFLNFANWAEPITSPEAGWLRGSRAVEALDSEGPVTVWRVRGRLDPAACGPANAPLRYVPGRAAEVGT